VTGIYVRVERAGQWQKIEIDQMTDTELEAFVASQPVEQGWAWAVGLARWIRDHVHDPMRREDHA
jgi:hypothetical protein